MQYKTRANRIFHFVNIFILAVVSLLCVLPFINLLAEKNYFSKEGIEAAIDWASRKQKTELLSILMNEQHKRFPKKKKTFEL